MSQNIIFQKKKKNNKKKLNNNATTDSQSLGDPRKNDVCY